MKDTKIIWNVPITKKESYYFFGAQKDRTINKVLDPLIDLYEISHMHLIQTYKNNSLCEIESDQKEERGSKLFSSKNRRKLIFLIK